MSNLVERLRKNCEWQRVKGTHLGTGYPYHKHIPDCDICQSADRIEELEAVVDKLESELYGAIEQAHMDGQYTGTDGVTFPHIAAQQYAAKHAIEQDNESSPAGQ